MSGLPPADPDLMGDMWGDDDWDPTAPEKGVDPMFLVLFIAPLLLVVGVLVGFALAELS